MNHAQRIFIAEYFRMSAMLIGFKISWNELSIKIDAGEDETKKEPIKTEL